MNELIRVEEGQLIIAQKSIEKIKAYIEKGKENNYNIDGDDILDIVEGTNE